MQNNWLILLLKRIKNDCGSVFAGVNFSTKECKFVRKILDFLAKMQFSEPITLDRRYARVTFSIQQLDLELSLWYLDIQSTIERLPVPVVSCAVYAILAAIMPELPLGSKPLNDPALRLSDNEAAEQLELQTLRALMRDLNFMAAQIA